MKSKKELSADYADLRGLKDKDKRQDEKDGKELKEKSKKTIDED